MKKNTAIAALFGLVLGTAAAQPTTPPMPTAYRLYEMCKAQDPQCIPILRSLVGQITPLNPDCAYTPVSDERLWTVFMQVTSHDLTILRFSALTVTTQAFSVMTGCVHRLPPQVAAELPPPPQEPARPASPLAGDSAAQGRVRSIQHTQQFCSENPKNPCRLLQQEIRGMTSRGWCVTDGADPGQETSWHRCQPQQ